MPFRMIEGERVIRTELAALRCPAVPFGFGRVHLTNRRLIWSAFFPYSWFYRLRKKALAIPLSDIIECVLGTRDYVSRVHVIDVHTASEVYRFHIGWRWSERAALDWLGEIQSAISERPDH